MPDIELDLASEHTVINDIFDDIEYVEDGENILPDDEITLTIKAEPGEDNSFLLQEILREDVACKQKISAIRLLGFSWPEIIAAAEVFEETDENNAPILEHISILILGNIIDDPKPAFLDLLTRTLGNSNLSELFFENPPTTDKQFIAILKNRLNTISVKSSDDIIADSKATTSPQKKASSGHLSASPQQALSSSSSSKVEKKREGNKDLQDTPMQDAVTLPKPAPVFFMRALLAQSSATSVSSTPKAALHSSPSTSSAAEGKRSPSASSSSAATGMEIDQDTSPQALFSPVNLIPASAFFLPPHMQPYFLPWSLREAYVTYLQHQQMTAGNGTGALTNASSAPRLTSHG